MERDRAFRPKPAYQRGGQTTARVQVIDWQQAANNDFLLVSQFSFTGALHTCGPDLVGFVNDLLLVVIEMKNPACLRAALEPLNASRQGRHSLQPKAITVV